MSPYGGVSWSKQKRDFINTPATAPTALAFARAGDVADASALVTWLNNTLWDAERSLYIDGVNVRTGKVRDVVGARDIDLDYEQNILHVQPGVRLWPRCWRSQNAAPSRRTPWCAVPSS